MSKLRQRLKSNLRGCLAECLRLSGQLRRAERAGVLTVLCYHRVLPGELRSGYYDADLVVTPEALEAHCRAVMEHYEVLPLSHALAALRSGTDRPLAAITFDDGYRDNVEFAAPVLERLGIRATFFVIAGLVDTRQQPWYDVAGAAMRALGAADIKGEVERAKQLAPLERAAWVEGLAREARSGGAEKELDLIMTGAQLRGLAAAGHEIGAHSWSHPILTQCSQDELKQECRESKLFLETATGQEVTGFCYPNGTYNETVIDALRQAGFTYGATMEPGFVRANTDAFRLKRWFMHEERLQDGNGRTSPALVRAEISGLAQRYFRRQGTTT